MAEQRDVLGAEKGRIVLSAMQQRGFTLVELLVGLTLLALLLGLGVPAMGTYLQNSKLASAAASYFSGLQTARAEAIRRNVRTEFVLTDTPVATADIANAAVPAVAGRSWVVRAASGAGFAPALEVKAAADGEGSAGAQAVQVVGSAAAPAVFVGTIPFNGFGATADGAAYSIDITNPAAGTCAASGGPARCRRITVSPGGQIMACDPAAPTGVGDSRAC
jgi:type IV fimbrial biogenesis protein FimT